MQPTTVLGGPAEIAINEMLIPASLLSSIDVTFTEGTRDRQTLAGKFTRPSGSLDTAMVKFTMFLPSWDYLKAIFPDKYNAPTAPQTAGNLIFNASSCGVSAADGPVNIHYTCDGQSDVNDVYLYNGQVLIDLQPKYDDKSDLTIDVTIYANPDENGNVGRFGTGNLTHAAHFDATTMATVVNS